MGKEVAAVSGVLTVGLSHFRFERSWSALFLRSQGGVSRRGQQMADTRVQIEVEDWVRRNWMVSHFGTKFSRERLPLRSGGVFDFDAVSEDRFIVATVSTSGAKTSGGKHAVGKILKLRSDMLFLTLVEAKRRVIVLTERDMYDQCQKEVAGGRVPPEIEFVCAVIPEDLRARLIAARRKASSEFDSEALLNE